LDEKPRSEAPQAFPAFAVTVDVVALMIRDQQLCVLLVERGEEPFRGSWALPGGFVRRGPAHPDESLDDAARREFAEETGLELSVRYLAQVGAYGDPGRDPRGNVVSVAYLAVAPAKSQARAGGDAKWARWIPVSIALEVGEALAFDHGRILADAVRQTSALVESTALGLAFCKDWFTIPYLRRVYEILWDLPSDTLDAGNFHHRVMGLTGLVEPVTDEEVEARRAQDRETERRLGMMATLDDVPAAGRGRPPRWFRRGPLIREAGAAAPLERPLVRPRATQS
jgi:8-oxo-dGTP diphosphatase